MRKKIGECLIQAGLITEEQLQIALAEHKRTGERIGAVLVRLEFATETQITKALACQLGLPYANLAEEPPEPEAIARIPREVALERACVAVRLEKNLLTVAMSDPLLFSLVQDLEFRTGHRIRQVVATRTDILGAIEHGYTDEALSKLESWSGAGLAVPPAPPVGSHRRRDIEQPPRASAAASKDHGEAAPIVDLVDLVITSAITSRASDVHIEPQEEGLLVRHRLDGELKEVMDLPTWVHEGLVARIKVMAGMDAAEQRLPQDGRLRVGQDGRDVDFRVSTLPTLRGEKIVMRVLDHRTGAPRLEELGLSAMAMEEVERFLRHRHGMILVVGPAGSGRTTTLSSAISSITSGRSNIITVEDPIEYRIPGITQTQVNEQAKLTFAGALRAILRQDPDVVLVGEIRDRETARLAMQAATGHLVLATLHTDDAPSTMTRFGEMGIEPHAIASALVGVVAQRLVRRLCVSCRRPYTPDGETLRALTMAEADAARFYQAAGCHDCHDTGYQGRIAICEVMRITDRMRRLIAQNASEGMLRDSAIGSGMVTLGEDGLSKVKAGITTLEELLRVVTGVRETSTPCPGCGGMLQADWQFCPYCSTAHQKSPKRRLRDPGGRAELEATNVAAFKNQAR